jgi:hypothetical protein
MASSAGPFNPMVHVMTRSITILFTAVVLLLIAAPVRAWNSIGHMAVAKLAYDQLDAKQQLTLYRLLKKHPHYDAYLAAGRPAEIENEAEWVVLRSAVWCDWIRPRKNDKRDVSKYHRGEDHYINIAFFEAKDEKFFAGKTLVNPDLPNIVSALKHRSNELKTKTVAAEDRAVAACWVFHLIGDIHQPLHNVAYFSSEKGFIKGDMGGNGFGIKADGKKWRLHAYWDDLLGEDPNYTDDGSARQAATYREAVKIAEQLRGLKLTDTDLDKLKKNTTFESWSREGFELAKSVAYRKGDGSLLKPVELRFNSPIPDEVEEVGREYMQAARGSADRQVVLAGRRLADRLKVLLTP